MAKIHHFQAGYCTHPSCVATRRVKGKLFEQCEFPARVFLIEANNRFWLVDTGYSNHFFDASKGIYSLYRKVTPVYFNDSEHIHHQLKNFGLSQNDLSGIILSHFHADHIAGLKDFPTQTFIGSQTAFDFLKNKTGLSALKHGFLPKLMPIDFENRFIPYESFPNIINNLPTELQVNQLNMAFALPNSNNEIIIVPLEGHAIGHIGVLVLTDNGWELIAGDAAWSDENYTDDNYPSPISYLIMHNVQSFYHSLNYLKQLHNRNPNLKIHLSHDLSSLSN